MRPLALLPLIALSGCSQRAEDTALAVCEPGGETRIAVLREIHFTGLADDGTSLGFDLDDRVSDENDSQGCYVPDFEHPDGGQGIDNAWARLLPALEATEFQAVDGLIQDAIKGGELLILVQLDGVNDETDDACVDMTILRAEGTPAVGTDDLLLRGQTFDVDTDAPTAHVEAARISDRSLVAGPLDFELPLRVLNGDLVFVLEDAWVRMDLNEDGSTSGYLSGAVDFESVLDVARDNANDELISTMEALLGISADLERDALGYCTRISVVLDFEGVSAFVFDEEPSE